MATILAVSSFVARGTVGLRAIQPAYDRMGHEVIALPTILLSNHLGHTRADGAPVASDTLRRMIEALDANGWLERVDSVQTGYLPTPEHVRLVEELIGRVRVHRSDALIVCDPVLGDHPIGLYVPQAVAEEVRDRLVPLATHVKPNPFELEFLTGRRVESVNDVVEAARALGANAVLASSVPLDADRLANVVVADDGRADLCAVRRQSEVPHGTGDLLTALFTAHALRGEAPIDSAARAAASVERVIELSKGKDELQLYGPLRWDDIPPLPIAELRPGLG
jgi:pyridoxine kinase